MFVCQKTIRAPISFSGIGLHFGREVNLTIRPASAGNGIVFVRLDFKSHQKIQAVFNNVAGTQRATTLVGSKFKVCTVEHLLAALFGAGIDNALIEIDGEEIPIYDGSAKFFYEKILETGAVNLPHTRDLITIKKPVEIRKGDQWARIEPCHGFEIHSSIDFPHPKIGKQTYTYLQGKTPFSEVASSRTFGFLHEIDQLRARGLITGGSLDNAVVLNDTDVINSEGLRTKDEFVRHKVLDAIGDFSLAQANIYGSIYLHRSGHDLHNSLLVELFNNKFAYQLTSGRPFPEPSIPGHSTHRPTAIFPSLAPAH